MTRELAILATDGVQTQEIQEVFWRYAGENPSIVYIGVAMCSHIVTWEEREDLEIDNPEKLAEPDFKARQAEFEKFHRVYGDANCIYGGDALKEENGQHHQQLLRHANVICVGSGVLDVLKTEMVKDGLERVLKDTINHSENLRLFMGISAGTVYLGEKHPAIYCSRSTGEFTKVRELHSMLKLIPNTNFFMHCDAEIPDYGQGFDYSVENFPERRKFAFHEGAGLLFHEDRAIRIGSSIVLYSENGEINEVNGSMHYPLINSCK